MTFFNTRPQALFLLHFTTLLVVTLGVTFIILHSTFSYSQSNTDSLIQNSNSSTKVDSLNLALQTATHDTTRVNTLLELANEYYLSTPSKAIDFCIQAKKIAEKVNYKKGMSESYSWLGYLYKQKGQIKEALEYYGRSLSIQEESGDKQGIATSLNNIGFIYNNQGQIKEALEYFSRSLKIREDIGDKQGIANSLNNIGYIYMNQGQIKEVNPVERDSLFNRALEYFSRSLKIREDIGDKQGIATSLNNIGIIYDIQGQSKEALEYYGRSLSIKEEIGDKHGIATSLTNIGDIYLDMNDAKKAMEYASNSLNTATELGYPANLRDAEKLFSNIYKKKHNYKPAMEHYEKYIVWRDSVKNKENEKAAIRQHTKYEFEKAMLIAEQEKKEQQQQEAEAVSRRDMLQYSGILIGMFFLFGLVFFLGKIPLPEWLIELIIFVPFLIVFEFILVLLDPYIENYTGGAPVYKLLINAVCAAIIFPIHSFFEKKLKARIDEIKRKKAEKFAEEYRKEVEKLRI